jgi:hypothetical protein
MTTLRPRARRRKMDLVTVKEKEVKKVHLNENKVKSLGNSL